MIKRGQFSRRCKENHRASCSNSSLYCSIAWKFPLVVWLSNIDNCGTNRDSKNRSIYWDQRPTTHSPCGDSFCVRVPWRNGWALIEATVVLYSGISSTDTHGFECAWLHSRAFAFVCSKNLFGEKSVCQYKDSFCRAAHEALRTSNQHSFVWSNRVGISFGRMVIKYR